MDSQWTMNGCFGSGERRAVEARDGEMYGLDLVEPTGVFLSCVRFAFHPEYRQKKTSLWKRLKPKLVAEDPQLEALLAAESN